MENFTIEEFKEFYLNHTSKETKEKFKLSNKKLTRLARELGILKKRIISSEVLKKITREELVEYYITLNHSREECQSYFNISRAIFLKLIKTYSIYKPKELSTEVIEKVKLERYGNKGYNNYNKIVATNQRKYGYSNPFENKELIENSYLKKFGTTHPMKVSGIKNKVISKLDYKSNKVKARETIKEKYGSQENLNSIISNKIKDVWVTKTEEDKSLILEKTRETCLKKYKVLYPCQTPQAKICSSSYSKPNNSFAKILEEKGISYEREFTVSNRSYDFKVRDYLIEINPSATHNSTWGLFDKQGLPKDYHSKKSLLAKNNGFQCIHVFDWDNIEGVVNLLKPTKSIYARECQIREVSKEEVSLFLDSYHIQGNCRGQVISLGLYFKEELVEVVTFGKPRYNRNYQYELLRLCSKTGTKIIGGSSKLFKYFINKYNPESVISYCDLSKFSGEVYSKLGFSLLKQSKPSKHWYNIKTKQHITDNLLRQKGFDRLLGKQFGTFGKGTSNEELMLKFEFIEIYDSGQSTYIWEK